MRKLFVLFRSISIVVTAVFCTQVIANDMQAYQILNAQNIPHGSLNLTPVNIGLNSVSSTNVADWSVGEGAPSTQQNQTANNPVDMSLARMAECCKDNPLAVNCPTSPNNCNEFNDSLQRGIDPEFSNLGTLFFRISPQISNIEENPANAFEHSIQCTNCFEPAFERVKSSSNTRSFYDSLEPFRESFTESVANQMVMDSFQAFHQYNDMLHKHLGLYGTDLKSRIDGNGVGQYLCKDLSKVQAMIENPSSNSRCHSYKNKLGDQYLRKIQDRSLRWFQGQKINHYDSFANNMQKYLDKFGEDVGNPGLSCTNRTAHAQILANQFHSREPESKNKADLVYALMDANFTPSALNSANVTTYCANESVSGVTPFDQLIQGSIMRDESLVEQALRPNQSSELARLLAANGIVKSNYVFAIKELLVNAQLREPSIGLLLSNKKVFCESYVAPRKSSPDISSRDIIRKKNVLPRDIHKFQQAAASACDGLYQNIADSLCIDEGTLGNLPGDILQKALLHSRNQPASSGLTDVESRVLANSISCSHREKTAIQSVDGRFTDHISKLYKALPHGDSYKEWRQCYQGAAAELNYEQFKQAFTKVGENNTMECVGVSTLYSANSLYTELGLENPNRRAAYNPDALGGVPATANAFEPETAEQVAARRSAAQLHCQANPTLLRDPFQFNPAPGQEEVPMPPSGRTLRDDSGPSGGGVDIEISDAPGNTGGGGLSGDEINQQLSSTNDEAPDAPSSRRTSSDDSDTYNASSSESTMQQIEDLREQSRMAQENYQRVTNRFQETSANILNEKRITTNDVAENVDNEEFIEVRDAIADVTGKSEDDASQALINSLTNGDDGELVSELSESDNPQMQDLLAQIADLRKQIEASKASERAENVAELEESSDDYVKELEERIRQLESGGSSTQSRLKSRNGRSPAGGESQSLPSNELTTLGGVSSGRPSLFSSGLSSQASTPVVNPMGNAVVMNNIIKNPDDYIAQGDFNFEYRNNKLYLKVNRADLNEPVDIENVFVNEQGVVQAIVLPGNKTVPVSELSEGSREALSQYVTRNSEAIEQSREEQIAALRDEVQRVRGIQTAARQVRREPASDSAYRQLIEAFGN